MKHKRLRTAEIKGQGRSCTALVSEKTNFRNVVFVMHLQHMGHQQQLYDIQKRSERSTAAEMLGCTLINTRMSCNVHFGIGRSGNVRGRRKESTDIHIIAGRREKGGVGSNHPRAWS